MGLFAGFAELNRVSAGAAGGLAKYFMKIYEVVQPKTPEQQRLDSLRAASKRASDAVKQERDRQKLHKAQKTIHQVRFPQPPKP